jgi:hypothetical protein
MANQTIYGCYSAGSIVFEGEACDSGDYTGCYVSSGEHAGQIAVTVSEDNCDDTYYACFDSGTGQFNLEIPDDCCGYGYGSSCSSCPTPSQTPLVISVSFSGIEICENCIMPYYKGKVFFNYNPNSTFLLSQVPTLPCRWCYFIENAYTFEQYSYSSCNTLLSSTSYDIKIIVEKRSDNRVIVSQALTFNNDCTDGILGIAFLNGTDTSTSGCVNGTYLNAASDNICHGTYNGTLAINGEVEVIELA